MNVTTQRERAMLEVQKAHFALYDTGLYMDTHPTCEMGMEYYQQARRNYETAKKQYEANFGPLTLDAADTGEGWAWTAAAWPWELEG